MSKLDVRCQSRARGCLRAQNIQLGVLSLVLACMFEIAGTSHKSRARPELDACVRDRAHLIDRLVSSSYLYLRYSLPQW